jgi:hypothetical protein
MTSRRTAANLRGWTVSKFTETGILPIMKPGSCSGLSCAGAKKWAAACPQL